MFFYSLVTRRGGGQVRCIFYHTLPPLPSDQWVSKKECGKKFDPLLRKVRYYCCKWCCLMTICNPLWSSRTQMMVRRSSITMLRVTGSILFVTGSRSILNNSTQDLAIYIARHKHCGTFLEYDRKRSFVHLYLPQPLNYARVSKQHFF